MNHAILGIPFKPHRLDGFPEVQLITHYENVYGQRVQQLNRLRAQLYSPLTPNATPVSSEQLVSLHRDCVDCANAVYLHELYFSSLGAPETPETPPALLAALNRDFGGVENWRRQFITLASDGNGDGWALLSWLPDAQRLVNQRIDGNSYPAGALPLLALDLYEHAYRAGFDNNVGAYGDAFCRNIDWPHVAERFAAATGDEQDPAPDTNTISVEALQQRLARGETYRLLDVRLSDDLERSTDRIADSDWHDPQRLDDWADALPKNVPFVAYCMYGFWVSQNAVAALRERGIDARTLSGGIAAWRAMDAPTQPL